MENEEKGKCDYCGSEKGEWYSKNTWHCFDCDRVTVYFEITELGKRVLEELGIQEDLTSAPKVKTE